MVLQTQFSRHQTNNSLDVKKGFGSTLAFISASGGASVGQYGPLVHFGATVATFLENFTSKRLPTWNIYRVGYKEDFCDLMLQLLD